MDIVHIYIFGKRRNDMFLRQRRINRILQIALQKLNRKQNIKLHIEIMKLADEFHSIIVGNICFIMTTIYERVYARCF